MTINLSHVHNCDDFNQFLLGLEPIDEMPLPLTQLPERIWGLFRKFLEEVHIVRSDGYANRNPYGSRTFQPDRSYVLFERAVYTIEALQAKFEEVEVHDRDNPDLCRKTLEIASRLFGWSFEQIVDKWCEIELRSGTPVDNVQIARTALIRLSETYASYERRVTRLTRIGLLFLDLGGFSVYFSGLGLRTFPPLFGHIAFKNASNIFLDNNRLTEIPTSIELLSSLKVLDLSHNRLPQLPYTMGGLDELVTLDVSHNELRGLPFTMPFFDEMRLNNQEYRFIEGRGNMRFEGDGNPWELRARTTEGERIITSRSIENIEVQIDPLERLAHLAKEPLPEFSEWVRNSVVANNLRDYTSRIHEIERVHRQPELARAMAKATLMLLQEAERDPFYRTTFIELLQGAVGACGDRALLAVIEMEIARNQKDEPKTLELLARSLRVEHAVAILKEEGLMIALKRGNSDEALEFGLTLIMRLKDHLGLPIQFESMLFPEYSRLSDVDITQVEERVRAMQEPESFANYLATHDKWTLALEKDVRYQDLVKQKEEDLGALMDRFDQEPDASDAEKDAAYAEVRIAFEESVRTLTLSILRKF